MSEYTTPADKFFRNCNQIIAMAQNENSINGVDDPMTDRELVIELCRRLGLSPSSMKEFPLDFNYLETPEHIRLGCGSGYSDFECIFEFNGDKLTGHRIIE